MAGVALAVAFVGFQLLADQKSGQTTVNKVKLTKGSRHTNKDDLVRVGIKNTWVSSAATVVTLSGNLEAETIMRAVLANMVTVEFWQTSFKSVESGELVKISPAGPLSFFPLISADAQNPQLNRLLSERRVFARFDARNHAIEVFNFAACSQIWKGISLLHEGFYARNFPMVLSHDPHVFVIHEVLAQELQNKVVSSIGGKQYEQLLNAEVARMRKYMSDNGLADTRAKNGVYPAIFFPVRTAYNPNLDAIFSPAMSQLEKDARQNQLWLQAAFTIYDQDRGGHAKANEDAENGKRLFLYKTYAAYNALNN